MVLRASHRMIFSNTIARAEVLNPYTLLDGVGDLVPDELIEGGVLMLGFEGSDVGGHLGSVLHTLAGSGADSTEAGALCDLGLGEGGGTFAADVGEIGVCQHSGVGGGSRTVHIGGTGLLGDFARDMVNRVEIKYFSHSCFS